MLTTFFLGGALFARLPRGDPFLAESENQNLAPPPPINNEQSLSNFIHYQFKGMFSFFHSRHTFLDD